MEHRKFRIATETDTCTKSSILKLKRQTNTAKLVSIANCINNQIFLIDDELYI